MAFFIYLLSCMIVGIVCEISNISIADWKWWVLLCCMATSYICGKRVKDE